jgi:hypothetical protein
MIKFSVTKYGIPLDPSLYTWDEKVRTFSSKEEGLVLDFTGVDGVTFKTYSSCIFKTGHSCTFKTGHSCTFNTRYSCTFKTDSHCTFKTDSHCTFDTGPSCTFKTDFYCAFNTGPSCIFEVGVNCCLIRYDVKGVTEIPAYKKIQLNGYETAGYTVIEEKKEVPTCNGKVIEIDGKQYKLTEIKK